MEITLVAMSGIKIRGKHASVAFDPSDKAVTVNAAVLFPKTERSSLKLHPESLILQGPGDYEVAGIKISGIGTPSETVYVLSIDTFDVMVGEISVIEKMHQKLKECDVLILNTDQRVDASFVTSIASHSVVFYGAFAEEVVKAFAKDSLKTDSKYQITKDKLPQEMETVLLK